MYNLLNGLPSKGFQALSPNLFVPWIKSIQQYEAQKLAMLLLW